MKPNKYAALSADWNVNLDKAEIASPSKDSEPNQILIFSDCIRNGAMSASITPIGGQRAHNMDRDIIECAVLFRYNDRDNFYLAGLGGFGMKFFIAKVSFSEWRLLLGTGRADSLRFHEPYHLRVEFSGDRITLLHNDVPVVNVIDGTFFSGRCGLLTNIAESRFENVDIEYAMPKCFVIMPFDPELDFVYEVIKETVGQRAMDCQRADERFISEPIMEDVKRQISEADLIIVDFSGRNPNVYFEAGLADAWKKKLIVLAQSTNDLHIHTIIYSNKMGADSELREDLGRALQRLGAGNVANKYRM